MTVEEFQKEVGDETAKVLDSLLAADNTKVIAWPGGKVEPGEVEEVDGARYKFYYHLEGACKMPVDRLEQAKQDRLPVFWAAYVAKALADFIRREVEARKKTAPATLIMAPASGENAMVHASGDVVVSSTYDVKDETITISSIIGWSLA